MDFKTFLIKNSTIKKSFIDDFYEIIKEDYFELSDKFLIDSNKLQTWLNISSRKDFHETIKRSYVIDIDYIIVKKKRKALVKVMKKFICLHLIVLKCYYKQQKVKDDQK